VHSYKKNGRQRLAPPAANTKGRDCPIVQLYHNPSQDVKPFLAILFLQAASKAAKTPQSLGGCKIRYAERIAEKHAKIAAHLAALLNLCGREND